MKYFLNYGVIVNGTTTLGSFVSLFSSELSFFLLEGREDSLFFFDGEVIFSCH